jgi:dihydrofolate synthase / folylpolyglutamate synthase
MTYEQAISFLGQVRRFGVKLGLENMQELARQLGDPQKKMRFIHIAGTNGKGSTAAFCAQILRELGIKTGLYTSPHLVSLGERIQIDGVPMPSEAIAEGMTALQPLITAVEQKPAGAAPTFFEVITGLALWHFARNGVEWVVWETGMGGRLDATNIVMPEVSIITSIALDHAAHLGTKLEQIAYEKAGIIKPGVPCVTAVRDASVLEVINSTATRLNAPLCLVGLDFSVKDCGIHNGHQHAVLGGESFRLGLLGAHQVDNAACAVAAIHLLEARGKLSLQPKRSGISIEESFQNLVDPQAEDRERSITQFLSPVRQGLAKVVWPGRFQVLHDQPPCVVDGAHNPAAQERLLSTWCSCYGKKRYHLVCAFLSDKEYDVMFPRLLPLAERVTLVQIQNERALAPEKLLPLCGDVPARVAPHLKEIWPELERGFADGPTLLTGSLFLAGEVLALGSRREHQLELNERLVGKG